MWILSKESGKEHFFDTPGGPYTVNRKPDPENETSNPPSHPQNRSRRGGLTRAGSKDTELLAGRSLDVLIAKPLTE